MKIITAAAAVMPTIDDSEVRIDGGVLRIGAQRTVLPAKGDFVVVWEAEGKSTRALVRVLEVKGGSMRVVWDKGIEREATRRTEVLPLKHTIANLGSAPANGSAYGVSIKPWLRNVESRAGLVCIWHDITPEEEALLLKTIDATRREMAAMGLAGIFPVRWLVTQPGGSHIGMYTTVEKPLPDGSNDVDTIEVKPKKWDSKGLRFLLFHEYAHGLDFRLMNEKERAAWVSLYHSYVRVSEATGALLQSVFKGFMASGRDYSPPEDSDEAQVWEEVLEYYGGDQRLGLDEMVLLRDNSPDEIRKTWPKNADISRMRPMPTEYAETSPGEFWAECFGLYMLQALRDPKLLRVTKAQVAALKNRGAAARKPEDPSKVKTTRDRKGTGPVKGIDDAPGAREKKTKKTS